MNLRTVLDFVMAMIALGTAFSVYATHPLAAILLTQFSLIVVVQYESKRMQSLSEVRSIFEDHMEKVTVVKILLLVLAVVDLLG